MQCNTMQFHQHGTWHGVGTLCVLLALSALIYIRPLHDARTRHASKRANCERTRVRPVQNKFLANQRWQTLLLIGFYLSNRPYHSHTVVHYSSGTSIGIYFYYLLLCRRNARVEGVWY